MTIPTAPGWYDDPDVPDQLRYFDGVVWSAHTTPRLSPTAATSTIGHSMAVPSAAEREHPRRGGPSAPQQQGPPPTWSTPPAWERTRPGQSLPDGAVLAEWWRRLLARVVDALITGIIGGLLSVPFLGPVVTAFQDWFSAAMEGGSGAQPSTAAIQAAITDVTLPVTLIGLGVGLLYEVSFLVWRSATPGKMLFGTVVRPLAAAGPVTLPVAARRQAIKVLTTLLGLNALLGLFGFFLSVLDPAWLLWDPKRQALHDKVADTVVVLKG